MAVYDHKQAVLVISGYEIKDFDDSSDAVSFAFGADAGGYTIGANGKGVFVANGNKSGTLTLKVLQHSADNKFLSQLRNQQENNIGTFAPMPMFFRDTLNGDTVTGEKGYFTVKEGLKRGQGHNSATWTIQFEKLVQNQEKGLHN